MLTLANVLALALIAADEPKPPEPPPVPSAMPKIPKPRVQDNPEPDVVWPMTLPEAIRIGLDNSEVIRVISLGAQVIPPSNFHPIPTAEEIEAERARRPTGTTIAPLNYDGSTWKFKADVMAHVRSIEQQYWALSHQNVVLWGREAAVRIVEEILERERAGPIEGGRAANPASIAEAEQRLENARLELVGATSDVITTERQLRNILGLPPADHRRIVPATPPTEARVEPDWEASVRQMLESQPDIAQQKVLARLWELQLLFARNQLLPPPGPDFLHEMGNLGPMADDLKGLVFRDPAQFRAVGLDPVRPVDPEFIAHQVGLKPKAEPAEAPIVRPEPGPIAPRPGMTFMMPIGRGPLANTRQAQYQVLRQQATLEQIVHQATHSLARFFLEIDANYKQYRTAQRLRGAARQRLEAERAFYDEGRVAIDRVLDAVIQYSNAIAQESQFRTCYNTSIASLEEAKGTLLAYDDITVVEGPARRKPAAPAKVDAVAKASFDQRTELPPLPPEAPAPTPQPASMTYKIKASLGGSKLLEIEVEVKPTTPDR